jgi:hypothetical protein
VFRARTFIVHVYTRSSASSELRGVVEALQLNAKLTFRSYEELREILGMSAAALRRRASRSSRRVPSAVRNLTSAIRTNQEVEK